MTEEDRIRQRAHEIWVDQGRPAGGADFYREQAAAELLVNAVDVEPDAAPHEVGVTAIATNGLLMPKPKSK